MGYGYSDTVWGKNAATAHKYGMGSLSPKNAAKVRPKAPKPPKKGKPYGQGDRATYAPKPPTSPKPEKKGGNTSVNTRRTGSTKWETTGKTTRQGDARRARNKGKRTTYDFQDFNRYRGDKTVSGKREVLRDVASLKKIKGAAARRAYRTQKGLYKGNYYGPEVFKGNEGLNKAWEKSGRKGSASTFAANYRKAGNR
jgi:hypothetical protein